MGSGVSRVMTGSFVGTGASLNVRTVGFRPRAVKLINVTSNDSLEWHNTMSDAAGYKCVAAGTRAMISTKGITPLSNGFTLGADTDMNVAAEQVSWVAYE